MLSNILEWKLVERGLRLGGVYAKINGEHSARPAGDVPCVHPRANDIRVGPSFGIERRGKHRFGNLWRDVEGANFCCSHEAEVGVLRQSLCRSRVRLTGEIRMDSRYSLTVKRTRCLRASVAADDRNMYVRAVQYPIAIRMCHEDIAWLFDLF